MAEISLFEISMLVAQLAMVGTVLYQYPNLSKKLGHSFGTFIKSVLHGLTVGCFAFFTMIFISYLYISLHDTFQDFRNKTQKPETVSESSESSQPEAETVSASIVVPAVDEVISPSVLVSKTIITADSLVFSDKSLPEKHKDFILKELNRLQNEDPLCNQHIEPAMTSIAPSRATKSNPVFYVPCGNGANVKNRFFSLKEEESKLISTHKSREVELCAEQLMMRYFSVFSPMTEKVRISKEAMRTYKGSETIVTLQFVELEGGAVKSIACSIFDDEVQSAAFFDEAGKYDFMLVGGRVIRE